MQIIKVEPGLMFYIETFNLLKRCRITGSQEDQNWFLPSALCPENFPVKNKQSWAVN